MPTTSATRLRTGFGGALGPPPCCCWNANASAQAAPTRRPIVAQSAAGRAARGARFGSIFNRGHSQTSRGSAEEPLSRAVDEVGVGRVATARSHFDGNLPAMVGAVHADVRENVADRAFVTFPPRILVRDDRGEILGSDVGEVVL